MLGQAALPVGAGPGGGEGGWPPHWPKVGAGRGSVSFKSVTFGRSFV